MKRISHEIEKSGPDLKRVKTLWRDRFKRPAHVSVVVEQNPEGAKERLSFEGDAREVDGILAGLAEIAWENGWRPRGLDIVLGMIVKQYKLPPENL